VHVLVVLRGPTGQTRDARLVLDTGTPVTILKHELAAYLDLGEDRSEGPSRLWGPNGADDGYRVRPTALTLMARTLTDRQVRCHRLWPGAGIDGLVGLDIIGLGRLTLDLPWGLLEFKWN
jgi:hypothetical protein